MKSSDVLGSNSFKMTMVNLIDSKIRAVIYITELYSNL